MHHKLIYKRTNVMQLGSMFISNCSNTIAVTNKHTGLLVTAVILLQLLINILPSCITLVLIYKN